MVGFNRRYAPHTQAAKRALAAKQGPKSFVMTVNAGAIPASHWVQDPAIGGGRIIGEACHFIDLLRYLAAAPIVSVQATAMETGNVRDTISIALRFADGSIGTVNYFANGSKAVAKERLEIFAEGSILQLDNFRALRSFNWRGASNQRLWRQDKGQQRCVAEFIGAIESGAAGEAIPFEELTEVMEACFTAVEQTGG
jgi:predicted dehydrogenase